VGNTTIKIAMATVDNLYRDTNNID